MGEQNQTTNNAAVRIRSPTTMIRDVDVVA